MMRFSFYKYLDSVWKSLRVTVTVINILSWPFYLGKGSGVLSWLFFSFISQAPQFTYLTTLCPSLDYLQQRACGCQGVGRVKDGSVFLRCCTAQGEWEGCFRFGVDSGVSVFLPLSPCPSLSRVSCAAFLREAPTGLGTFRRGPDAPLQPPVALPGSLTSPWLSPLEWKQRWRWTHLMNCCCKG